MSKYRLFHGKSTKIICCVCGKERLAHRATQKCCSIKCSSILRGQNPEYRKKISDANKRVIAEGRHTGWTARKILSFAEKFFINVLNNNGIVYETNKPMLGYFLDFAINDKMLDLEIDGKQHKYPERKQSDLIRDKILTDGGWKVYRIEWNDLKIEDGKRLMQEKINKFLGFFRHI